jgi:hypothetical protein
MWFISSQRDMMGAVKGALVIVILLFMPAREIRELSATTAWNLQQLAVVWALFGAGFLAWPRLRHRFASWRGPRRGAGKVLAEEHVPGREVDLILGTSRPWMLIAALAIPILIASRIGQGDPTIWLFFLTVSSIAVAGTSGQAAERSRSLWLRSRGSRCELFAQVERSLWRHNVLVLSAVMLLFLALGYRHYSATFIAIGLPLLALSTLGSSYLGLMMTRGLGWVEIVIGASLVLMLMWLALLAGMAQANIAVVTALELVLAGATITFRVAARRRWARLDWSRCRPAKLHAARGRA